MPLNKKKRSWNRLKDLYFIWVLRKRYRWWRLEVPRREQAQEPLGIWLYLIKKFVLERTNYFTPANLVSFCRGLLAYPVYLLFDANYIIAALMLLLVGIVTDFIDGHLARAFNQETHTGKLADPFFDKVLIGSTLLALVKLGVMPWWLILSILALDAFLIIMAIVLKPLFNAFGIKRIAGANEYGKWKFTFQVFTTTFSILALVAGPLSFMGNTFIILGTVFGTISLVFALGSIIEHAFPGSLGKSPDILVRTMIKTNKPSIIK